MNGMHKMIEFKDFRFYVQKPSYLQGIRGCKSWVVADTAEHRRNNQVLKFVSK